MSQQYALRIDRDDAATLGRIRCRPGIEVCDRPEGIWLRVSDISDELEADLRALPGTRYSVLHDGQLVEVGNLVPQGQLPDQAWVELKIWMSVSMKPAALGGVLSHKVDLQIVRNGIAREANVLVTDVATWQQYSLNAPQVRLDGWAFATNGESQVVVRGMPLPSVHGVRYVEQHGVAIEAGWAWSPPVDPDVLACVLDLEKDDLALLHADGSWDYVSADDFVRATRSAVRLSMGAEFDG